MSKEHIYQLQVKWTGNNGTGTSDYKAYERSHLISAENKPDILASSDTPFRGDASKYNPEEFLLASLSSCHMLWFLHFCADNGVIVLDYVDNPIGTMIEIEKAGGKFTSVTLRPLVTVSEEFMIPILNELHEKAHKCCFIANSVNFEVKCEASETIVRKD